MKKDPPSSRQLAAIVFTDIVGYTRLMGDNEDKALRILAKNKSIQKPLVEKYNGRWLKEIGDGTLTSFNSALDAVYFACKLRWMLADDPDMNIRIGIHIGDVTFRDGDIFGDGVNIASRLEMAGSPNEILISDVVYSNIRNVEGMQVTFVKEAKFKNVKDPMRIYRVKDDTWEHQDEEGLIQAGLAKIKKRKKTIITALAALIVLIIIVLIIGYQVIIKNPGMFKVSEPYDAKSVAVIPFEYRGNNPDYSYISTGLTEDILFRLVKINDLKVIHQSNLRNYEPAGRSWGEIGKEMGVAHILTGSVTREENRLVVKAQLYKTSNEELIWTNEWNRPYADLFKIQSEVAVSIASVMKVEMTEEEVAIMAIVPTSNITAYDLYWKGRDYYYRFTDEANMIAMELFYRSLDLDPQFTLAHAGLSDVYSQMAQWSKSNLKGIFLDSAYFHAMVLRSEQPEISSGYKSLGLYYSILGNTQMAIQEFGKAVEIDENIDAVINLSRLLFRTGQLYESLALMDMVKDQHPLNENLLFNYGATYYRLNDFDQARFYLDRSLLINPTQVNSLLSKWMIATIDYNREEAFIIGNKLGVVIGGGFEDIVLLIQYEIQNNTIDPIQAAETLEPLVNDREMDYIDIPYLYVLMGYMYHNGGKIEKAREMFEAKLLYNKGRISEGELSYRFTYESAQIYAILGEKELAYQFLKESLNLGWSEYPYALVDPAFRDISNEKQFKDLVNESKFKIDSLERITFGKEENKYQEQSAS